MYHKKYAQKIIERIIITRVIIDSSAQFTLREISDKTFERLNQF